MGASKLRQAHRYGFPEVFARHQALFNDDVFDRPTALLRGPGHRGADLIANVGTNAVARTRLSVSSAAHRSRSTVIPSTQRSLGVRRAFFRTRMDSRRL